jgi:hypothetical protein
VTTVEIVTAAVPAAQRGNCVKCRRAPGRARAPQPTGDGLIVSTELLVCDRCWYAAGGLEAVQATLSEDGELALTLEGAVAFEALIAAADRYDQRHPIDRFLIGSGIRWETLRHIAVPARCDLVRMVLERVPLPDTRLAISADVWIQDVTKRIEQQTGSEFRYNAKRRRWWRIANVLRCCSDDGRRPLTWISQEEIAAAVGCSTRTVRRCVAWLQREGLLHEVLPGCQMPRQAVPDDETASEQAEREARLAAAEAAEDASRARARAEIAAVHGGQVHGGLFGDQAAEVVDDLSPADETELNALLAAVEEMEHGLVQLVPVYELRVPIDEAVQAEEAAIARAHTVLGTAGEAMARHYAAELVAVVNAHVYRELFAIGHDGQLTRMTGDEAARAVTCGKAVGLLRADQNGHPPEVIRSDQLKSRTVQDVDKGPASPGTDQEGLSCTETGPGLAAEGLTGAVEGDPPKARQSEAVRAAEWLLRSRLHPVLCEGISVRWLAAVIRGSRLLADWAWTWEDLADLIHGEPEYAQLPRWIRNPPGWIRARFRHAVGYLSPTKRKIIRNIERGSTAFEQRRQAELAEARRTLIRSTRTAIDACSLCDQLGWASADPSDPTAPSIKCTHNPETGGW